MVEIKKDALRWFVSYLEVVKHKNCYSECNADKERFATGDGAGLILFLIYINDILNYVSYNKTMLFADDTILYIAGIILEDTVQKMNSYTVNNTNINIIVNNRSLEEISEMKYLGAVLNSYLVCINMLTVFFLKCHKTAPSI